ncbi:LOW QUALITY PROTEIN: hypothetical protein V1477_007668 [Vespula maculifrons]|uniref:Transmembrane protein n=1 Tax=Vespula maculifrons TaxID=7453 RepID=A0ABD2CGH6_VESMC
MNEKREIYRDGGMKEETTGKTSDVSWITKKSHNARSFSIVLIIFILASREKILYLFSMPPSPVVGFHGRIGLDGLSVLLCGKSVP